MNRKCQIRWIDTRGLASPDTNDAIGEAYVMAHTDTIAGRAHQVGESQRYGICADHARRLRDPGMQWWRFLPACVLCQTTDAADRVEVRADGEYRCAGCHWIVDGLRAAPSEPRSVCRCTHDGDGPGSAHVAGAFGIAPGHGRCTADGCSCQQFTWAGWRS